MPSIKPTIRAPGNLECSLRAGVLLSRFITPWPGNRIIPTRCKIASGLEYDLYQPTHPLYRTVVMIYGLTLAGEQDFRLVKFARAFAASGFLVIIPVLPGLKSFRIEMDDLTAVTGLVCALHAQYKHKIGLVAFSVGAGLALAAAAQPSLAGLVDPLLLFGPYYSLAELWTGWLEQIHRPPIVAEAWDDYIYLRLALAYRSLEKLNLADPGKRELTDLLANYCWEPNLARKRRVLASLKDEDLSTGNIPEDKIMGSLSPSGKLEPLSARVLILHDKYDLLIPPHHSERLYTELSRRSAGNQQLLITPLLSHVNHRKNLASFDLFKILRLVGEIFR